MRFPSPLRYPGGKSKLSNFFMLLLEKNNFLDYEYVEPYAGGASIALKLLYNEYVRKIHINDIDISIFAFWHSVVNHTSEFIDRIKETSITVEEWKRQSLFQNNRDDISLFDLGFSTFFLNRTNRSGIISGGIIGGKKQDGKWKIDARFNKENLIKRIKKIALYKERICLYNLDAEKFIEGLHKTPNQEKILYLDPPYYKKGKDLYENFYSHDDHRRIANFITNSNFNWVVSYDNKEPIRSFYEPAKSIEYNLSYSAGNRYKGSEVMFFSDSISIPQVSNPAKV